MQVKALIIHTLKGSYTIDVFGKQIINSIHLWIVFFQYISFSEFVGSKKTKQKTSIIIIIFFNNFVLLIFWLESFRSSKFLCLPPHNYVGIIGGRNKNFEDQKLSSQDISKTKLGLLVFFFNTLDFKIFHIINDFSKIVFFKFLRVLNIKMSLTQWNFASNFT